jgi:hypothetical protein
METAVATENQNGKCAGCECGSVVGLASAVTFAAAGTLLSYSLLARRRRIPVPVQLLLGLVAGGAGVMTWRKRQEELAAARQFMDHVHDVRDKRWLKKHPVAYG